MMAVPTIALYASPPSSVVSHPCSINSHSNSDSYELMNSRCCSSSPSSSSSSTHKPVIGGLSCLFSSNSVRHSPSSSSNSFNNGGDELGLGLELGSSFKYNSSTSRDHHHHHSPVSVFQGPVSCGSVGSSSSRSSPMRISSSSGLFNGFVRNALDSACLDYDSPSFNLEDSRFTTAGGLVDELTFSMDGNFSAVDPCAKELLLDAQSRHKIFCQDIVVKAFHEAEKAHRGQMRASGDPYLQHCVETAMLLAMIGANPTVVAAGLLHDTLDDSFMSFDYIISTFGEGVADLVKGVSKLSHLSKLARENNTANRIVEADRLHTMFLAMADARAVLIKLADRLHNMMTLEALPLAKQKRFAKETVEIFVPLANRLGISSWKDRLENLCFKYLKPDQHDLLSSKLVKSFDDEMITSSVEKLEQALKDAAVSYHVLSGRHKSLYSIYSKMIKKKLTMDQIHDIHGLRLIVENEEDCYTALKIVHQVWPEVPGKFKDYIIHPKINGYQSLHTVVMGEDMAPLEVQIRTKEMHLQAECGFAAHWRYKEGDSEYSSFVLQMVEWARWVVTWQCETMSKEQTSSSIRPPCPFPSHSDDCPYSYAPQCTQDGPVFVIMMENEKMSVQEFPANSTVMDLMIRVGRGSLRWSPYRYPMKEELRPRLNREPVSDFSLKLQMGDVVELTPTIPDKSLTEYREEIQRMYDQGRGRYAVSGSRAASSSRVGWRS
ncbi:hypothetical protein MKW94_030114 [Papaver nudicaule]|uniref:GTP diphosphokinase n=1 Tax=Papaver nudicaule TaxID=74823 RepID=A0AA41VAZ8_PAPNU|nr:hypothetical protein [Papaver nudicaule]